MKRLVLFFALVAWLAACSGPAEPTPTPVPPTPTPSPQDWLNSAVETFNGSESFHFTLNLAGRTIALDETGLLAFDEAEGDVAAPDRLRATTLVQTLLGNAEISYIAIGDDQFLTNPLNGQWERAPAELQTDVASLFDPEVGIGALLADMGSLERLADEPIDGTPSIHLRGTLPASALDTFASDVAGETLTVDLWLGSADTRIRQVVLTEAATGGEAPTWTFRFSQFDAAPAIEPPL